MTDQDRWQKRYETGDTPWDTGRPDFNLTGIVERHPIAPARALEIGCGTGIHSQWLAQRGFTVTGIDISELAVERARELNAQGNAQCRFLTGNFLTDEVPNAPYGFAFDRGCFHSFDSSREQRLFVRRVAHHLGPSGLWFSMSGSTDDPPRQEGPPMRSATQIVSAVEPLFEIISLTAGRFDSKRPVPPRAWLCLMRKRG